MDMPTPSAAASFSTGPSSGPTPAAAATAAQQSPPPWIDPLLITSIFHATVPLALLIPGAPGPLLVNAPRNSYLPALLSTIPHVASVLIPPPLLQSSSPTTSSTSTFDSDAGGQLGFVCAESRALVKWYYPIGVLFDVYRPTPPPLPSAGDPTALKTPTTAPSDHGSSSGDDEYAHIESPTAHRPSPSSPTTLDDAQIKALLSTPWRIHVLLKRAPPAFDIFSPLSFPSPLLPDPDPDGAFAPAALDTIVPYTSLDNLASMYRNEVKQAEYIKYGSSKKTNALGKADSELLWDAIVNNNLTNAEPILTSLLHTDPIARAWPIRVHIHPALKSARDTRPYLQPFIPVASADTIGHVIQSRLGFADVSVVVQGLHVSLDTPLAWVHRHLVCVDGWMYLVVVPPILKRVAAAGRRAEEAADVAREDDKEDADLVLVDA
ncbi:autophagy protein Apg5-domain-containing protein [Catenaria anguillulae PL171]|uniref:Autophagy protein 5 n=1 Tax=Catenaria anguillulae PL171 TaxID=765915 RepID=A0A1Y2HP26_9FUNG|nr:autophagy protein Apg5-domain-containing protein [Catenaria anguillulae PL171]